MRKKLLAVISLLSVLSLQACGNVVQPVDSSTTEHTISRNDTADDSTAQSVSTAQSADTTETDINTTDTATTAIAVFNPAGTLSPVKDMVTTVKNQTATVTTATGNTVSATGTVPTTTVHVPVPSVMRGNLYDCKGTLLMYSEKDASGKEQRMTNDANKVAFANILNEMSDGLDSVYDRKLRTQNPTSDTKVGQSIRLTFDADIQNAIYSYMQNTGIIGSAVVMRSDGSIAAEVSYPSYDPDIYYGTETEEDLAWGTYGNKAFQNFPPGSCFKIMSEVISDKHGIYSLYDEGTWYYDGTSIVNWDHDTNWNYPIERSLYSAFTNSSNIFFARSFDTIGKDDVLADLENIFHFVSDIDCDFGTISNNIEIYCNDDLRRSAFGQSYVMTCPLYLAALGREAVFGDMVKPFTVQSIVDTNDVKSVIGTGSKDHEVIGTIPAEYRQNLLDGMTGVGGNLGIYVPSGYSFYAKTGTAETWEGDFLYITGVLKNTSDNGTKKYGDYSSYSDSYIIVTQFRNPQDFGFNFASESASLYQGIVNCVVG